MSIESNYNLKSPGVKRLMREACELAEATDEYYARPLEDNLFEWHFTVRGPPGTDFDGGLYHGRIILPFQYPMQPPNIILLTPNGRFEINKKICLSISGHHPESWQPSWSIRTALLALIAFMPTSSAGTIGSLEYTPDERAVLAKKSKVWECHVCGKIAEHLSASPANVLPQLTQEETTLIQQIALKAEEESSGDLKNGSKAENNADVSNSSSDGEFPRRRLMNNTVETNATVTGSAAGACQGNAFLNSDNLFSMIKWGLVVAIVLLVIRRIFFLQ